MLGKMDWAGLTDTGRVRPVNEDQFLIASLSKSMSSDPVDNLCYPDVYLDGVRLATQPDPYRKPPQPPLIATDINQFAVKELAGVEFHPGAATSPARYNAMGQGCGQLMLWTREK